MLTNEVINDILDIKESYQLSEKLMQILKDKETREAVYERLLTHENDLSFDWFTNYFQQEHADRNKLKQDYTPDCLCTIMNNLSESAERIADICAGTGGLTIKHWNKNKDSYFHCEEISNASISMLLLNLSIRGIEGTVFHGNSLTNEYEHIYKLTKNGRFSDIEEIQFFQEQPFDCVIMNPPYSLKWEPPKQDARFNYYGLAPKSKADYAFVLHGLHMLKESGTLLAILPHGVLFRGSSEETIRKTLIDDSLIDCVVGLPEKLFLNTSIPTLILKLKKNRADSNILFIDSSENFTPGGKQNNMTEEQIEKVVQTYKQRKTIDKFSYVASIDDVKKQGYNLNIPRYVDTYEKEPIPPIEETLLELQQLYRQMSETDQEIIAMVKQLEGFTPSEKRTLDEFVEVVNGVGTYENIIDELHMLNQIASSDIMSNYTQKNITEVAELERAKKGKIYPKGCTLIQLSATKGQIVYLDKASEVDTKYAVIIPKKGILSKYLYITIEQSFPEFFHKNKSGLNLVFERLNDLEVNVHHTELQPYAVKVVSKVEEITEREIKRLEAFKEEKKFYLENMFV